MPNFKIRARVVAYYDFELYAAAADGAWTEAREDIEFGAVPDRVEDVQCLEIEEVLDEQT